MKWLQWICTWNGGGKERKTRDDGGEIVKRKKIVWSVEAFIIALLSDYYDDGVSYR